MRVNAPRRIQRRWLPALPGCLAGSAHAHTSEPQAWAEVWLIWNDDWWLWLLVAVAGWLYARGLRRLWHASHPGAGISHARAVAFLIGWLVTAVALLSPLDPLGGQLFSAHMLQHELLMLLAAPLLVAGRPLGAFLWGLPQPWRRHAWWGCRASGLQALVRLLSHPVTAWLLHAAALWVWHVPALFQAAVESEAVHTAQHASFFFSALLFWWALLRPGRPDHAPLPAALYLLTTGMHGAALGALLTLSPRAWYPIYQERAPQWGMTALEDQQLGGLIMWVPAGAVYLLIALVLLAVWLRRAEAGTARLPFHIAAGSAVRERP